MSRRRRGMFAGWVSLEDLAALDTKPNGELVALQSDINSMMQLHGATSNRLRLQSEAISSILRRRTRPGYEISDHAVVRYLEKVKAVDIEAVRTEIAQRVRRAAESNPGAVCRAKGDAVAYIDDGVSFVVARLNCVVTVYPDGDLQQQARSPSNDDAICEQ